MLDNTFKIKKYGELSNGSSVHKITLINRQGMEVDILTLGGIVSRWISQDRNGEWADIILGLDSLGNYERDVNYLGAIIGRYANRIANSQFPLNDKTIQLVANEGVNQLHGGDNGFNKQIWDHEPFRNGSESGVKLHYRSEHGEMGFPGMLNVEARYTLTQDNALTLEFRAMTDKTTVVNLSHHLYFNLSNADTILNHNIMINADRITTVNEDSIPNGEFMPVFGSPFDFLKHKSIGQDISHGHKQLSYRGGYDHNWVVNKYETCSLIADVYDPDSGRQLSIYSTAPGVQFYAGNHLDGSSSGKGQIHSKHAGFCLEPQAFPNSPNQPNFPSTILHPGEEYVHTITYQLGIH